MKDKEKGFHYFACEMDWCTEGVYCADIHGAERCVECGWRGDNDSYRLWLQVTP